MLDLLISLKESFQKYLRKEASKCISLYIHRIKARFILFEDLVGYEIHSLCPILNWTYLDFFKGRCF